MADDTLTMWGEVAGEFMPIMEFPASQAYLCPYLSASYVAEYKRGKQPIKRIEIRDSSGATIQPNRP